MPKVAPYTPLGDQKGVAPGVSVAVSKITAEGGHHDLVFNDIDLG